MPAITTGKQSWFSIAPNIQADSSSVATATSWTLVDNKFAVFVRDLKSQDKSHHRWKFADMGTAAEIDRVAERYSNRGWETDVVEVEIVGLDEAKSKSLLAQLHEEPFGSPGYLRLKALYARRVK